MQKMDCGIRINMFHLFWIGPANVRIPSSIKCVPTTDENNEMEYDGSVTEANQGCILSEEEYRNMYAVFNEKDRKWYWILGHCDLSS